MLVAAALVGAGSAIFHPESSRIARLASGGRHGLAQSIFQVGGKRAAARWGRCSPPGSSFRTASAAWPGSRSPRSSPSSCCAKVSGWYKRQPSRPARLPPRPHPAPGPRVAGGARAWSIAILLVLIFSKYFYLASISSYYNFYLIEKFHLSVQSAQMYLFLFLFAAALGGLIGGPVGDRIGRKRVIWFSILGVAPFTLLLPYVDLAVDRRPELPHRTHPGLGLLRHSGVRAGAHAGQSRRGVGAVLRFRVRHGRHRRRRARRTGRPTRGSSSSIGCAPSCRCSA